MFSLKTKLRLAFWCLTGVMVVAVPLFYLVFFSGLSLVMRSLPTDREQADQLWKEGKRAEAAVIYRAMVEEQQFPHPSMINRVLESYEAAGDREQSQLLLRLAAERGVEFSNRFPIYSPELGEIYQEERKRVRRKQAAAMARSEGSLKYNKAIEDQWYGKGTLHEKTALDWQIAAPEDKLGTCADLLAGTQQRHLFKPDEEGLIKSVRSLQPYAMELVDYVDKATTPLPAPAANREKFGDLQVQEIVEQGIKEKGWWIEK
ncbi:hypothetical protein [Lignipirellula cremea]|nr:hypothetical protein [Lignipirellula cremea]